VSVTDRGRRLPGRRGAGFGGVGERVAGCAGGPVPGRRVGAGALRGGGFLWGFLSAYRRGFLSGYLLGGKAPSGGLGAAGRRCWPYRCLRRLDSQRGSFWTGGDGPACGAVALSRTADGLSVSRRTGPASSSARGPCWTASAGTCAGVLGCVPGRRRLRELGGQPRTAAGAMELARDRAGDRCGAGAPLGWRCRSSAAWAAVGCRPVSREVGTGRPVSGRTTYLRDRQETWRVTCVTFSDDLVILNRFSPGFFIGGFSRAACVPRFGGSSW
jgi:hypothetical protein